MGNADNDHKIKTLPRIFVRPSAVKDAGQAPEVDIPARQRHHLRNVLRLGKGAKIIAFDGSGKEYLCRITEAKPSRMTAGILETGTPKVESPLTIMLAQALVKQRRLTRYLPRAPSWGAENSFP